VKTCAQFLKLKRPMSAHLLIQNVKISKTIPFLFELQHNHFGKDENGETPQNVPNLFLTG